MTSDPLQGRVALVTGAGRGIGREIALGLAQRGADIALVSRTASELERTAAEVRILGAQALALTTDVARADQVKALVATVQSKLGPIELLINNAAVVGPLGPTPRLDPAAIKEALATNVAAVIQIAGAVLPTMLDADWGQIVNISSGIAAQPAGMVGGTVYAASKAALEAHTINLAAELADTGVAANVYRPGAVDTAMQAWIRGQSPEEIGYALHQRFVTSYRTGQLLTASDSAAALLRRLPARESGRIWSVND